ncbi:hypothetical protein ACHAWF_005481 [Thalassiosira exigua]
MPSPQASSSKVVLHSLYRSLLRAAAPFSPPSPSAAVYASLLRRSGVAHDWEECVNNLDRRRRAASARKEKAKQGNNILPKSWARNLSWSYSDLQDEYALRQEYFEGRYGTDDCEYIWDDDEASMHLAMGPFSFYGREEYEIGKDPKFVLFRHLIREWFSPSGSREGKSGDETDKQWPRRWSPDEEGYYENGKIEQIPEMRFPCQISSNGRLSLMELIRREFRAPTVDERLKIETKVKEESSTPPPKEIYPPSSYIDNEIRIQTAFYTLAELNRKLAWADSIGFPVSSQQETKPERNKKRLAQAAQGVSHCPEIERNGVVKDPLSDDPDNAIKSDRTNKSPLQCGTYLVAHPLMTGYFSKTVIVLLDHADESHAKSSENSSQTEEGVGGGSYGLIINRLALKPEKVDSSQKQRELIRRNFEEKKSKMEKVEPVTVSGSTFGAQNPELDSTEECTPEPATDTVESTPIKSIDQDILRPISLLQAINPENIAETVQMAFGDAPVREGGPVHLSLQMFHRKNVEGSDKNTQGVEKEDGHTSEIGGKLLGDHDKPRDSEDAIYFGGDIMKASYAVLDGSSDRDDFSFVIGASCWAPGQLANEIERGCWLPFRGPPLIAMTGMADHNIDAIPHKESDSDAKKGTKLSLFPPRPSNTIYAQHPSVTRPVSDLWLSVMCSLGESEADLAYMTNEDKSVRNPFGDACDNFNRK